MWRRVYLLSLFLSWVSLLILLFFFFTHHRTILPSSPHTTTTAIAISKLRGLYPFEEEEHDLSASSSTIATPLLLFLLRPLAGSSFFFVLEGPSSTGHHVCTVFRNFRLLLHFRALREVAAGWFIDGRRRHGISDCKRRRWTSPSSWVVVRELEDVAKGAGVEAISIAV